MSQPGNQPWIRAWRIEHADTCRGPYIGWGPLFKCPAGCYWAQCGCHWPHPHPVAIPEPWNEKVLRGSAGRWDQIARELAGGTWRYACRSLAVVRKFFGPVAARRLHAEGYVLRQMAVRWDAHMIRRVNLIYDPTRARLLRTINLAAYAAQMEAELATLRAIQVAGDIEPLTGTKWA